MDVLILVGRIWAFTSDVFSFVGCWSFEVLIVSHSWAMSCLRDWFSVLKAVNISCMFCMSDESWAVNCSWAFC